MRSLARQSVACAKSLCLQRDLRGFYRRELRASSPAIPMADALYD